MTVDDDRFGSAGPSPLESGADPRRRAGTPVATSPDQSQPEPRQWEIRLALRALARTAENPSRGSLGEQILTAALELINETDDFTVKQLAERAGVALQTFYRHFGTKDELLLAMMEENIGRGTSTMITAVSAIEDPVERLHQLVSRPILQDYDETAKRRLRWSARERQRLSQVFPQAVDAVHQPFRSAVEAAIEDAVEAGMARSPDPSIDAYVIQHLVLNMVHLVHGGGIEHDPTTVADRVWAMCWQGLAVDGSTGGGRAGRTAPKASSRSSSQN